MPLSVEDWLKVQRLYAEYVQRFDRGDRDGWLDLFTDDLVYRIVPRNATGEWSDPVDIRGPTGTLRVLGLPQGHVRGNGATLLHRRRLRRRR